MKGKKGDHSGSAVSQFSKDFQTVSKGFQDMTKAINIDDEPTGGKVELLIEEGKNVELHPKRLHILEKNLTTYAELDGNDDDDDREESE